MEITEDAEGVALAVAQLASPDVRTQYAAIRALNRLGPYGVLTGIGLTKEQAITIMQATFREYPLLGDRNEFALGDGSDLYENTFEFDESYQQKLLSILRQCPHPELTPYILELYPKIDPSRKKTRWQALELLSCMPQRDAAEAWLRWYTEQFETEKDKSPPFSNWARDGLHADLLLPALVRFSRTDDAWLADQWNSEVRRYLQGGKQNSAIVRNLVRELESLLSQLTPYQDRQPGNWMWLTGYFDLGIKAASLADVLGYASKGVTKVLRRALKVPDPSVQLAAALSLVRQGVEVSAAIWNDVAAWPATRLPLYKGLKELGKAKLFPRRFARQQALAESDMVGWMIQDGDPPPTMTPLGPVETNAGRFYAFEFSYGATGDESQHIGISGPWGEKGLEKLHLCGPGNEFTKRDSEPFATQVRKMLKQ